jgi:molybdate transport system substrate-binding protein
MKRLLAALLVALLALAACSSGGGSGDSSPPASPPASQTSDDLSGSIQVDAAASLTGAFTTLGQQFQAAHPGTSIKFSFDASSTLETQINQGAPVDVFASASTSNMDGVVQAGNAAHPTVFVTNEAEIAVPPDNPAHIAGVADLAKSGVKVALCDTAVPCGVVAAKVFANAHITVTPVAREANVKSTLAVVQTGDVDAGVVYVTDVKAAGTAVTGVPIPDTLNASTDYPIATLSHAKNLPLAQAFVAYVLSSAGIAVLTAAGFRQP